MSLGTVTEVQLQIELWRSFLSVFRSYAILDKLMSIPMSDGDPDGATISKAFPGFSPKTGRRFELFFGYTPKTNNGYWNIVRMQGEVSSLEEQRVSTKHFSLNPDGTVRVAGVDVAMDHAAIDILQEFKAELNRDEIGVLA
jgi:hypothetical protein